MWGAGWLVVLGLWLAALFPAHAVTFHHLVFIGGYGLLTLAIGTRVVVGHGRHPVTDEGRVLSALVVAGVVVALALRVAHDWLPPAAQAGVLAASAASWIVAWLAWAVPAGVRIAVVRHGPGPDPPSRGRPGVVGAGVGPTSSPPAR